MRAGPEHAGFSGRFYTVGDALERTQRLITGRLGVTIGAPQARDAYREAQGTSLDGEWLGGFAQAGVVLHTVSAVSARIEGDGGAMIDEYGESTLVGVTRAGDRVEFAKHYAVQRLVYVGRLGDGVLSGYWYSALRPQFAGVFWLTRADRLDEATLATFRKRVRSTSPRRAVVRIALPALMLTPLVAMMGTSILALLAAIAANVGFFGLLRLRTDRMRREAQAWRTTLG